MLPWIGRSLIVLLILALTILVKANMESGFIAFALAMAISIVLSAINDGLITLSILALLVGKIIASGLWDEKLILPWSEVAIIIITAVLIEILLSTSQDAAFLDFFTLISTILIITFWPYFLTFLPTVFSENISLTPVSTTSTISKLPQTTNLAKCNKPVMKAIVKSPPTLKPKTNSVKKPIIKSVTTPITQPHLQSKLNNTPIIKVKHNSNILLTKTANEQTIKLIQREHLVQGTAQRILSIAAMVAIYLIIL